MDNKPRLKIEKVKKVYSGLKGDLIYQICGFYIKWNIKSCRKDKSEKNLAKICQSHTKNRKKISNQHPSTYFSNIVFLTNFLKNIELCDKIIAPKTI